LGSTPEDALPLEVLKDGDPVDLVSPGQFVRRSASDVSSCQLGYLGGIEPVLCPTIDDGRVGQVLGVIAWSLQNCGIRGW
jgi:hypothetical protein